MHHHYKHGRNYMQTNNLIKKFNAKNISLAISIIITLIVFSMSLASGTDSGELSSGFSVSLKSMLDKVFIGNTISIDTLHIIVRKGAHVFEYFILGVSYFFTAKYWKLSVLKILTIGLLTATIDELLQSIPADRTTSAIDIFLYDFGGFILGVTLFLLLFNRKVVYSTEETLKLLSQNQISQRKAYKRLFSTKDRIYFTNNAHFVKLKIKIPGEKGINRFLAILFFLPFPIFIVKLILPFIKMDKMDIPITKAELMRIISSKNINLVVNTSTKEKIIIKTI